MTFPKYVYRIYKKNFIIIAQPYGLPEDHPEGHRGKVQHQIFTKFQKVMRNMYDTCFYIKILQGFQKYYLYFDQTVHYAVHGR